MLYSYNIVLRFRDSNKMDEKIVKVNKKKTIAYVLEERVFLHPMVAHAWKDHGANSTSAADTSWYCVAVTYPVREIQVKKRQKRLLSWLHTVQVKKIGI